jgi:predicted DNA-binding helix-hairpin-helix protein
MKNRSISPTLMLVLLLAGSWTLSAYASAAEPQAAVNQVKASAPTAKAAPKVKLVDINSASAKELATLPGLTADDAANIVVKRPYGSKTWLVTQGVIPEAKYTFISGLVVAKQPFKDAAKNVEALKKPHKPASQ